MADYEYTPVNDKAIRLLNLLPGQPNHALRIQLKTFSLSHPLPKYEALSYAWGSSEKPDKVVVIACTHHVEGLKHLRRSRSLNETTFTIRGNLVVTQNLATALCHLRWTDESRNLWIDAICINQQDVVERGAQVAIMGAIYTNASQVLVWLGPESEDSALAVETLSLIGSQVEVDWGQTPPELKPGQDGDPSFALVNHAIRSLDDRTWRVLDAFFSRPWFTRLWIWQEVRLANFAWVICGTAAISWTVLGNAVYILFDQQLRNPLAVAYRIGDMYNMFSTQARFLLSTLDKTNSATCTDPRDRIYSLMNLVEKVECIVGLKPDYSAKPHEIFQQVVMRYRERHGHLNILSLCEMSGTDIERPTWVPDLSKRRMCQPLNFPRSCWMSKTECSFLGDLEQNQNLANAKVLRVTGMHVTTVETVKQLWSRPESIYDVSKSAYVLRDLLRSLEPYRPYVAGGSMIEAFCRAVHGDNFADNHFPEVTNMPTFSMSNDTLVDLLVSAATKPVRSYFSDATSGGLLDNRAFLITRKGYIGFAPQAARPGDEVCIILGCQSPLLLRPTHNGNYEVVGECYLQGVMHGEAILGPLPAPWTSAKVIFVPGQGFQSGFFNGKTRETRIEDPRLGPLPPGWRILEDDWMKSLPKYVNDETGEGFGTGEHYHINEFYDPRMTAQALIARGVTLRKIDLV
ncbi:MAG: hypothetical protein Q9203_001714 [Teloschistes exilis]